MKRLLIAVLLLSLSTFLFAQISGQTGDFNKLSTATSNPVTSGTTITERTHGRVLTAWYTYHWSNADVVALDTTATTQTGNIKLCTLPAGCIVKRAILVTDATTVTGVTTLTASVGRTSTAYVDFIVATSVKSSGTKIVVGDAIAEVGASLCISTTGLTDCYLASSSAVYLQFITTTGSEYLHSVLGSSGTVYLEVETLPL